jgi:8-amino-7-oxononanoate synthase
VSVINLAPELNNLKTTSLYRELVSITPVGPTRGYLKGREVTLFCTNNYLGLTHHPQVIEASIKATKRYGTGAGASRLISGHSHLYEELEAALARHKGTEKALVFSSGYAANIGVISALMGRDDLVFCDRLSHASLIDACILSRAKLYRFRHNDVNSLGDLLHTQETKGQRLIVTEGVFSMDGDIAPIRQLADISSQHGCLLLVDDAHGTGVMGEKGQGTAAYLGVSKGIDIHVGTLSKAIAAVGGFVAGSSDLISYLINKARSFIYTTALPPGVVATATAVLKLIETEPSLLEGLRANVRYMRGALTSAGFDLMGSETPIIPILVGEAKKAVAMSRSLLEKGGIYVPAIRPPTVPAGQARLRLTVSAAHERVELEDAAALLVGLGKKEGIIA